MTTRPSMFRKGGGRLNGVDGTIVDYLFTPEFPFETKTPQKKGAQQFEPRIYALLTVRVDGADEDIQEVITVAKAEDFEIEDEGKSLSPVEEGNGIYESSKWAKFIASFVTAENGLAEEDLGFTGWPDDRNLHYDAIVGRRVRFTKVKDEEVQAKFGRRKNKKTGKEYDRDYLTVSVVYADEPATKSKPGAKASSAKTASKPGKAAKPVDTDRADEALLMLVEKFGESFPKSKLASAPAQLALKKQYGADADSIRRQMYDDDYLAGAVERGIIGEFDLADKNQTITAAA